MNNGTDYDERERKVCSPCCHDPHCPNTNCLGRPESVDREQMRESVMPASLPAALLALVIFLVAASASLAWFLGEMS